MTLDCITGLKIFDSAAPQCKAESVDLGTPEQIATSAHLTHGALQPSWVRKGIIPAIREGHRTKRFDLERVRAVLEKLEIQEGEQK